MGEKHMKKSTKRTVGWGSGAGIGVTFVVLTFVLIISVQNGGMMNLHGQDLVSIGNDAGSEVSKITPFAGGDEVSDDSSKIQYDKQCGDHSDWIGHEVDEDAVKYTGKNYRILPPGSMVTMDYIATRINVHVDENGIVIDVRCG